MKIAIVRTDKLGDMILTLPMIKAVKELYPLSYVSVIARKYTSPLLENQELIDKIFFLEDYTNGIKDIFKQNRFDIAFFPRPRFDEALQAYLSKIPDRVGSGYRWYSFLFNQKVFDHRKNAEYHEAEYNIRLIDSYFKSKSEVKLLAPIIEEKTKQKVSAFLDSLPIQKERRNVIIHPGSGGSSRDLSAENFGKIARLFSEELHYNVFITGSENEEEKCSIIEKSSSRSININNKFNLSSMIAFVSLCDITVSNSTGILHIASALNKALIGFYPNSAHLSAKRWGPYTDKKMIFSPPCYADKNKSDNLELIDMEKVLESIRLKYGDHSR